jgi:glycosylphosphatidylinositol transamidase (GPIT) subunit GPI8
MISEKRTVKSEKLGMWLCAAFVILCSSLFISCKQEDDKIVLQTEHTWVDKKVAVVYPNRNAITKAQLERTAQWFLDNFQEAQLSGDVCVRLHLEWYDELSGNLDALSTQLANDTSVVAIVGPFNSNSVEVFAKACQTTEKPLIAPTATSEEVIRRYAVPTQSGARTVRPFLWSLTESDVAFTEVIMTAYAAFVQKLYFLISSSVILSPDNLYGKTFFDWAPFQAENLSINLSDNQQYSSTAELLDKIKVVLNNNPQQWEGVIVPTIQMFCVLENLDQFYSVAEMRRQWYLDFSSLNEGYGIPDGTPIDDPIYDDYANEIASFRRTWIALSDFSQEEIDALTAGQRRILEDYQGFSPYADPTTGFEISYERKFGVKPTFEECKFYDGLLLAGLACHKLATAGTSSTEADSSLLTLNSQFNQAIYDLTFPNADDNLSASIWAAAPMQLYLRSLDNGQAVKFRGASGNIAFDAESCAAAAGTTYIHWRIKDGKIVCLNYFSSDVSHRMSEATVAWKYFYDENIALQRFGEQASDADVGITYAPLTDQYAVLVHASEGFSNYRHLADVLNVYQQLKRNGFDDDHIILIADRSVADDKNNPEPGTIRASIGGPDLMAGAVIDYDASELSVGDVARILTGQRTDYLPVVLPPDAGHNVFVYWSGHGRSSTHGGSNEFQWRETPCGLGLTTSLLRQAVTMMQRDNSFRKLLVVAEPCYAECVVATLEGIPGVLAMTGANAQEQSWADNWNAAGSFWMCDRFTSNFVAAIADQPAITYRDLYLYCAQHTLGSHARIVNAANFGNLYHTGPAEFIKKVNN